MYGIKRPDLPGNDSILCRVERYTIFSRMSIAFDPIVRHSSIEIDALLQSFITTYGDYSLTVHEFTEDELAQFTFNKLKG